MHLQTTGEQGSRILLPPSIWRRLRQPRPGQDTASSHEVFDESRGATSIAAITINTTSSVEKPVADPPNLTSSTYEYTETGGVVESFGHVRYPTPLPRVVRRWISILECAVFFKQVIIPIYIPEVLKPLFYILVIILPLIKIVLVQVSR
ncbi:unnamed protein product [Protopolystoma xenopodis]|uniref:Uncharacterized protein n=1 Tax=Protopolystoma xenopodis TaxID=117903 RepID=A0A3S5C0Q6_9PLAT|nr:unnamed protein product [Protopolystoma xenopodis]